MPSGMPAGSSAALRASMETVVLPVSAPGATETIDPSAPWTMPPRLPRMVGPENGTSTRTGSTNSPAPLMTVTVALPDWRAEIRPLAETLMTWSLLTK